MTTYKAYIILLFVLLLTSTNCVDIDIITTIAGSNTKGYSGDNGAATAADLNNPCGVRVDATGEHITIDVIFICMTSRTNYLIPS